MSQLVSSNPLLFHHFCHQLLSKITVIYVFWTKFIRLLQKIELQYELDVRSLFNENGDLDTALVYID